MRCKTAGEGRRAPCPWVWAGTACQMDDPIPQPRLVAHRAKPLGRGSRCQGGGTVRSRQMHIHMMGLAPPVTGTRMMPRGTVLGVRPSSS